MLGSFVLRSVSGKTFFGVSITLILIGMTGLLMFDTQPLLYASIALIGLGNSNPFPIIFAQALNYLPQKKNEVSGLMIMGLFGGTIFPLLMGVASDAFHSQQGAIAVLMVGVIYLLYLFTRLKK